MTAAEGGEGAVKVGWRVRLAVEFIDGKSESFLVPTPCFVRYKDERGVWPQDQMQTEPPQSWAPWMAWWCLVGRQADAPALEDWLDGVDWIEAEFVPTQNPFGDGARRTSDTSRPSSSGRPSASTRSSSSPTKRKPRSGVS